MLVLKLAFFVVFLPFFAYLIVEKYFNKRLPLVQPTILNELRRLEDDGKLAIGTTEAYLKAKAEELRAAL